MSNTCRRNDREDRHLCAGCRERKAKYRYRGRVRADRQHVLCFECFRSARERMRARQLAQRRLESAEPLRASLGAGSQAGNGVAAVGLSARATSLTAAQIQHRQRMLAHLQWQAAAPCLR